MLLQFVLSLLVVDGAFADDLHLVEERLVRELIPSTPSAVHAAVLSAQRLESAMLPGNCTWTDIDYDEFRRAGWPMESHLSRALEMSVGWKVCNASATLARAALLRAAQCSLQLWLDHDFLNPNWFDNMITTPSTTSKIALVLGDALAPTALSKVVEITTRSVWQGCPLPQPACGSPAEHYKPWTGANIAYMLSIQINRGVLTSNATAVAEAFHTAFAACVQSPQAGEGIMVDSAFHQHGPQLLAGSYGAAFTNVVFDFVALSTGTAFAIAAPQLELFSRLVLEGQACMSRGGSWDWQVVGRDITIAGSHLSLGVGRVSQIRAMAAVQPGKSAAWHAFADRLTGNATHLGCTANKAYYTSDYVAHAPADDGWLFSVHMHSARTKSAACVNAQGKKSRKLGDGATALYLSGTSTEYRDVFVAWDWNRPPGTTTVNTTNLTCAKANAGTKATFVGSVSDSRAGAAAQVLRTEVSAHKSWHFFQQFVVCLGLVEPVAGPSNQPSFTTLEQSRLLGTVTVSQNATRGGAVVPPGKSYMFHNDVRWLHHGRTDGFKGTAYFPLVADSRTMALDIRNRTGNWSDIGVSQGISTLPVFDLSLTHGAAEAAANVSSSATAVFVSQQQYGYLVLPATSAAVAAKFDPSRVHTQINQAVNAAFFEPAAATGQPSVMSATFFEDHDLDFGAGWRVSVDTPLILLVTTSQEAQMSLVNVSVSVPYPPLQRGGAPKDVHVLLDRVGLSGQGCNDHNGTHTRLTFTPPTGDHMGKTQQIRCHKLPRYM
jgi:hypothetical protein